MISKDNVINRINRHFGNTENGLFDQDMIQASFITSAAKFFDLCPVILSQKVIGHAQLMGLSRIYSITDFSGLSYRSPQYELRGQTIYLINPSSAVVNYCYNWTFTEKFLHNQLQFTTGHGTIAEQSIYYFMLYDLYLQLGSPAPHYRQEAQRLAYSCTFDIIKRG